MTPLAALPMFVLIGLSVAGALYYGVVWWRAWRAGRLLPTTREGLRLPPPDGGWPSVCVIVPAHNEEAVIGVLARSLMAQDYPGLRIVFSLDRCTDGTEEVLRGVIGAGRAPFGLADSATSPAPRIGSGGGGQDAPPVTRPPERLVTPPPPPGLGPGEEAKAPPRASKTRPPPPLGAGEEAVEIVRVTSCPEGWAGKTHAAWRGVCDSEGAKGAELLLFADADTEFDPVLVRASVALLLHRGLDLLSLLSRLTCDEWFERLVQPAAGFELVRQYPLDFVNREVRPRAFANGQFMLFRRWLYDRIGGHERVKGELLEDIAFARHLDIVRKTMPSRWGVLMTDGMLRCRMYRDWESFRRGWKRIYTEASGRRPKQLREWAWRKRVSGVLLPVSGLLCAAGGSVAAAFEGASALGWLMAGTGVVSLVLFAGAMGRVYRDQGVARRWLWTYPLGAWRVADLLGEAARDLEGGVKTVWGGREYAREVKV